MFESEESYLDYSDATVFNLTNC